jgi:hypothetical protein
MPDTPDREERRTRLLAIMRRMDCQDLFDDAFYALVQYERAHLDALTAAVAPFARQAASEASRPHVEDGYITGPGGLTVGDWRALDAILRGEPSGTEYEHSIEHHGDSSTMTVRRP